MEKTFESRGIIIIAKRSEDKSVNSVPLNYRLYHSMAYGAALLVAFVGHTYKDGQAHPSDNHSILSIFYPLYNSCLHVSKVRNSGHFFIKGNPYIFLNKKE